MKQIFNTVELIMLRDIIAIAKKASEAILDVYNTEYKTYQKDDLSPVTEADLAAHHIIEKQLKALDSTIPILSEESVDIPWSERKTWQRYWIVDPLDGTKEFIKGNGEFTVNIALIEHGIPVLGVVSVPVTGVCYFADRSTAWKQDDQGECKINVSAKTEQSAWRVLGSRSSYSPLNDKFIAELSSHTLLSAGSSLKFCLIAEGKADIYPRYVPTSEWDTAAAQCILNASGGEIISANSLKPLMYNQKASYLNDFFIAYGCSHHEIIHATKYVKKFIEN